MTPVHLRERFYAVEVPKGVEGCEIRGEHHGRPYQLLSFYGEANAVDLPPGTWQIICTSKECTKKVPNGIVECKTVEYDGQVQGTRFVNYMNSNQRYWFINKTDSLRTLLASKGCDPDKNYCIIQKKKIMDRREKFEKWAKQWEDKVPGLAKALRSDSLHQSLNEMDVLILGTRISERRLIVYVLESSLMDENFPADYKAALRDEVSNHNLIIREYEEELNALTTNIQKK